MTAEKRHILLKATIWTLRIAVGAVFIMSGVVKAVDPWGFVFKIEEYLNAFGFDIPRSIVLTGGICVCLYEFIFGLLLATGCCRRLAPAALTASMAVMLPLTAYIAVANPVSDCGCFGDFWVISNTATFVKNLVITLCLVFLLWKNDTGHKPVFRPAIQWVVEVLSGIYILVISLYGYNVQPMLDFRSFAPGHPLVSEYDGLDNIKFIYQKNGHTQAFSADDLPGDDWEFVERQETHVDSGESLHIFDSDGDDIAAEVIPSDGKMLIIVIPEPKRADISYTYFLNELNEKAHESGIEIIALLAGGEKAIDRWNDISMAAYDCYGAEDTQLKELARGLMSLVLVDNGIVTNKSTLSSLVADTTENNPMIAVDILSKKDDPRLFWRATSTFAIALLLIYVFQGIILQTRNLIRRKIRHKTPKDASCNR